MTLAVSLVAADREVWSGEATSVRTRTADGDIGILTGHAPLLSLLAPSAVVIDTPSGDVVTAWVSEGFVSVDHDRVTILSAEAGLGERPAEPVAAPDSTH